MAQNVTALEASGGEVSTTYKVVVFVVQTRTGVPTEGQTVTTSAGLSSDFTHSNGTSFTLASSTSYTAVGCHNVGGPGGDSYGFSLKNGSNEIFQADFSTGEFSGYTGGDKPTFTFSKAGGMTNQAITQLSQGGGDGISMKEVQFVVGSDIGDADDTLTLASPSADPADFVGPSFTLSDGNVTVAQEQGPGNKYTLKNGSSVVFSAAYFNVSGGTSYFLGFSSYSSGDFTLAASGGGGGGGGGSGSFTVRAPGKCTIKGNGKLTVR